jgi:hypothetical protein
MFQLTIEEVPNFVNIPGGRTQENLDKELAVVAAFFAKPGAGLTLAPYSASAAACRNSGKKLSLLQYVISQGVGAPYLVGSTSHYPNTAHGPVATIAKTNAADLQFRDTAASQPLPPAPMSSGVRVPDDAAVKRGLTADQYAHYMARKAAKQRA